MSVGSVWDLSSDAELITAVRSGEAAAFGVLYERHAGAARTVARQYSNSQADAEDAVAEAFSRVFSAVQGGGGPDVAFRAYLFTVLRRVAMERVEAGRRAQPTDDMTSFEASFGAVESTEEPTLAGFERGVVSQAYSSLPERWQAVLWYTEVEGLSAAEIAPVLGLTANGVAALAYRAREGLRQAYLQQHLASPSSEACTLVNSKLGSYVRGGLAKRETALVESHLEECGTCRALVLELGDVNHGMRAFIAPLVLGGVAVGVLHGLGFGGAVAAAAHTGGAAAGAGAFGGTPVGVDGGGAAGGGAAGGGGVAAGSGVLAGAGAATGLAAVAVGAAVLVGTPAAAGTAGSAGAAGAGGSGGGAATGLAGGAGSSAATGPGGLLGLVAAAPIAVIGAVAAVTVVAVAVGLAGVLGAFQTSPASTLPPVASEQTESSVPGGGDDERDDITAPDGSDPDRLDEPGPADPGSVDPAAPTFTPIGVTEPVVPSAAPMVPPTDPANLVLDPIGPVTFVAGVPQLVELTVVNAGGTASQVSTVFTFDPGVAWDVEAVSGGPSGGGGAAVPTAGATAWSCVRLDATTARCRLPGLASNARSTLRASVVVDDDTLDGERDLAVRVSTFAPGQARPASTALTARLSSPPARITVGEPAGLELTADVARPSSVALAVPLANRGGTTARDVHLLLDLPADLPAGVMIGASSGAGATCAAPQDGTVDCVVAALAPRSERVVVLDVTAPALDLASLSPFLDVDVDTSLVVRVPAAGRDVAVPLRLRSAPTDLEVDLAPTTTLQRAEPRVVTVGVRNTGGTRAADVSATIALAGGVFPVDLALPTDWTCVVPRPGSRPVVTCSLPDGLAAGAEAPLLLGVLSQGGAPGELTVEVVAGGRTTTVVTALEVRPSSLALTGALTTDLVHDASGTISFEVTNGGDATARDLVARTILPRGVVLDDLAGAGAGAGWQCEREGDLVASCRLDALEPGASAALVLPATATVATDRDVVVDVRLGDVSVVTATAVLRVASAGLSPRGRWTADGDQGFASTEVGAPSLTCDETVRSCAAARADLGGTASNNGFTMVPLRDADGAPAASSATLALPDGAEIAFAGLYWSANRYAGSGAVPADGWTSSLTEVDLKGPGAVDLPVAGEVVALVRDNDGREYYQAFAEVTTTVAAGGPGPWSVSGVASAEGRRDPVPTYYAGWSLVVVYALPGSTQSVTVHDGGSWVATNASTTFAFDVDGAADARVGVVAWEGDRNGTNGGDRLSLDGTSLTPVRWDGTDGSVDDAFTSTATGSAWANALGMDAKGFRAVPLTDGLHRLTASTGGDQYLVGAVTLTTAPR